MVHRLLANRLLNAPELFIGCLLLGNKRSAIVQTHVPNICVTSLYFPLSRDTLRGGFDIETNGRAGPFSGSQTQVKGFFLGIRSMSPKSSGGLREG